MEFHLRNLDNLNNYIYYYKMINKSYVESNEMDVAIYD